ncbi:cysteine-rich CWC family protein [Stutzerimonas stutzeri]|uniref:cysteine-rich CWC family protein n=1 Tax=Stutzerimonas stutzeri TaxID=316 RepID=UPI002659622A|nr:cysteine-rich CWC family protein [Stutzerimonas stutzeri]MCF6781462.1 cysteine-rich CWC family protein [Stutzerimonas stutzeri]MCF6804132.1 cysteine-rich CWC family protein [Stutzerimonas stutzeri]
MSDALDPTRCPLCGQSNQCEQSDPTTADQPCWCFGVEIDTQSLERIPSSERGKACLCARCARAEPPETT